MNPARLLPLAVPLILLAGCTAGERTLPTRPAATSPVVTLPSAVAASGDAELCRRAEESQQLLTKAIAPGLAAGGEVQFGELQQAFGEQAKALDALAGKQTGPIADAVRKYASEAARVARTGNVADGSMEAMVVAGQDLSVACARVK